MTANATMEDFVRFELSELDQIMPRLYVRWLLCIPMSQLSPSKLEIISFVSTGTKETLAALPLLQGALVPKSSDPSRLEVHVRKEKSDFDLRVQHHDGRDDETFPTYESLKDTEFPASLLPDKVLTPPEANPPPVLDLMATFIRGGILLCIKCHHAVVDGGGMGLVVKFLAQKCFVNSGKQLPAAIAAPSMDRSILPQGERSDLIMDNGFHILDQDAISQHKPKDFASMISHTFKFKPEVLQRLKSLCATEAGFVSTQDALTALLYGSVSYARGLRFTRSSKDVTSLPSVMGIAVDARGRLNPPLVNYAANVTMYATYSSPIVLPVEDIPASSFEDPTSMARHLKLPSLALQTRTAITSVTHNYIQSVISAAESLEDVSKLQPTFSNFFQGTDFFITSGADFPVFEQEWWAGGKVDAMRIPFKGHWDGSCAVLATEDKSKGLDVMLGLRIDDMAVVQEILLAFGARIV